MVPLKPLLLLGNCSLWLEKGEGERGREGEGGGKRGSGKKSTSQIVGYVLQATLPLLCSYSLLLYSHTLWGLNRVSAILGDGLTLKEKDFHSFSPASVD